MNETIKNKDAEPGSQKDDKLEEGLEGTFPGSDPVSVSQPGGDGNGNDAPDGKSEL